MPTICELKIEAKKKGLKGYSKLNKSELEKMINGNTKTTPAPAPAVVKKRPKKIKVDGKVYDVPSRKPAKAPAPAPVMVKKKPKSKPKKLIVKTPAPKPKQDTNPNNLPDDIQNVIKGFLKRPPKLDKAKLDKLVAEIAEIGRERDGDESAFSSLAEGDDGSRGYMDWGMKYRRDTDYRTHEAYITDMEKADNRAHRYYIKSIKTFIKENDIRTLEEFYKRIGSDGTLEDTIANFDEVLYAFQPFPQYKWFN